MSQTALVATCYQEAEAIDDFLDCVLHQSRPPDEIVLVDAGSDDGTVRRIQARIASGAPVRLIVRPGANRSVGRNLAIEASGAELIAVTDVGSLPAADWFERIIASLEADADVAVVAGYYEPAPRSLWEAAVAAATVPGANEVDPASFLPSSRSVAFRRRAWEAVGGYPEHACHNEDTPFDLAMKATGARFVFAPTALVRWRPQSSLRGLYTQFCRYARGDGEEGLWFSHYAKAYIQAAGCLGLLWLSLLWPGWLWGYAALAALYWARHAWRAKRRTPSWPVAALAPVANAIVDVAHLAGYSAGVAAGRPKEG